MAKQIVDNADDEKKEGEFPVTDFMGTGMSKGDILEQVQAEITESLNYVRSKRQIFRDRIKLYNNQRKQRNKIGIMTLYNTMNTLMALSYTDELSVAFGGKGFAGSDIAENIELLAKSDNEDMEMDVLNYIKEWDRFFFGVAIRLVHGYDESNQTPIVESMDPLCWLPDPQGGLRPRNFRYFGFEVEMSKGELTEDRGFFNTECLTPSQTADDETQQTKDAYAEAQGLDPVLRQKVRPEYEGSIYNLVHWYTHLNGKKYLLTLSEDRSEIVRLERIKPVYEKEKKDERYNEWGLVLNYFSPERNNPFGTSVGDLVEDKQRAKSILANLLLGLVKSQLYPMYLYDRDRILNRRDLDFSYNKMIGVRGGVDGAVAVMNKAPSQFADTQNVSQMLDKETSLSTGASSVQSGVTSDTTATLGENQMVQANANIRFALGNKINGWGEKQFWKLWYRCYVQFFGKAEEKIIEVTDAFGVQSLTLYRDQFVIEKSPKIIIKSRLESMAQMAQDRVGFDAVAPLILQDPTMPQVSRKYTQRHMLKLHGLSREQISVIAPMTPDEMDAHNENLLLARNETVKIEVGEDHLSHIVIHMTGPNSNAKRAHILAHKMAYIQSGQAEKDKQLMMQGNAGDQQRASIAQGIMGAMNAAQNTQKPTNTPVASPQPATIGA